MNQSKDRSSCSYLIALVVIGAMIYGAWRFFSNPDALEELVELVTGAAMCAGAAVLAIVLMLVVPKLFPKATVIPVKQSAVRYEATVRRTRPDFDTREAFGNIMIGLFVGLASTFFVLLLGTGLWDGLGNMKSGLICLGLFLTLVILCQAGMSVKVVVDAVSVLFKKRGWTRRAASAQATIVDRNAFYEVDYYGGEHFHYELVLRVEADPVVAELDGQLVGVRVSRGIYKRNAFRDTVRVWYSVESPLTLLIKGE